ncbi:hypothetical protein [Arsenicibacter rosenii]|uniref:Efflux transporter periplasmic adaptor subunit n=1 Tax=Arsenicibacter rosenii TaxID=1750698 RepID=A0A1S2VKP6_9BACT|nr:hypothetical protein [Arsenicibacter rosenii]OIN59344.1 hypothetical protein BLX24_10205 [Arsenicibacter rosenii]
MKKVLRIIGLSIGGFALIVAAFCAYLSVWRMRTYAPPVTPEIHVDVTEARVALGSFSGTGIEEGSASGCV